MEFKDEYRIQADKQEISNAVLIQTKNKVKELQRPRKYFAMKTLIIAVILISCMCVSVFAYEYHKYILKNNSAGKGHEYLDENESEQQINKTAEGKNISVTIKDVKADAVSIYVTVLLKTTDGTDLNLCTEECIPVLARQGFESAYFIVDNQNVAFTSTVRTDDGSDSTQATLELVYYNSPDMVDYNSTFTIDSLKDKEIKIVLENFQYEVNYNEKIDFTYSDIGTMLDKEGLAAQSEYSEVGTYTTYADGTTIPTYSLNAGSKKIYFSDKYQDTYIDNIGFHEYGEMQFQQLFVSIVPESETVKDELLSNLELLNTQTGEYVYATQPYIGDSDGGYEVIQNEDGTFSYSGNDSRNVQPEDGRIVLIFDAGMMIDNGKSEPNSNELTNEILKDYIFVLKTSKEIKTVQNTWTIDFNLKNVNTAIKYNPQENIQKNGVNVTIDKVEVSDSYLSIGGNAGTGFDFKTRGEMYLILSDGTKVDVGQKIGGGYEATGEFNIEGYLETLVNADDVVAIEIWDQTIELK